MPTHQRSPIRALRDLDARGGEVLAEHAVGERTCESGLPLVEVLTRIGVDGLVVATVQLLVADGVADQAASETTAHRSRRSNHDSFGGRRFVDPRAPRRRVGIRADACQVDGQHLCHQFSVVATQGSRRSLPVSITAGTPSSLLFVSAKVSACAAQQPSCSTAALTISPAAEIEVSRSLLTMMTTSDAGTPLPRTPQTFAPSERNCCSLRKTYLVCSVRTNSSSLAVAGAANATAAAMTASKYADHVLQTEHLRKTRDADALTSAARTESRDNASPLDGFDEPEFSCTSVLP